MGAGHSPHKVGPIFNKRTAQRPEEEAKRAGAENKPRNPGEEQPKEGEEEKEAQVVEQEIGAQGRVNTAANI